MAEQLGISRVTDITQLDVIGIPVYASIRPDAVTGSLCVNAGKGMRSIEAHVGAYMEAIEFALAEYGASTLENRILNARSVLDGEHRENAILDFCPVLGVEIDLDEPLGCVEAEEIFSGKTALVPSELVFLPCPPDTSKGCYFGSNSNGLASGNTVAEASLHGLIEVIERDIRSFQSVRDTSKLLINTTLPEQFNPLLDTLDNENMQLCVRHMHNQFNLPYFMAIVFEKTNKNPIYISGGYGCHLNKEIAITRAICEAMQSRLSFIHGGRDDLTDRYERFKDTPFMEKEQYWENLVNKVSSNDQSITFNELDDASKHAGNIENAMTYLQDSLENCGINGVYRVCYTNSDSLLQVVRILVPTLEFFNETTARVGHRLNRYVQSL